MRSYDLRRKTINSQKSDMKSEPSSPGKHIRVYSSNIPENEELTGDSMVKSGSRASNLFPRNRKVLDETKHKKGKMIFNATLKGNLSGIHTR